MNVIGFSVVVMQFVWIQWAVTPAIVFRDMQEMGKLIVVSYNKHNL